MTAPNEKKSRDAPDPNEADPREQEFKKTYASIGVKVETLTATGSWRVVESDADEDVEG